jgi:hypothetical protein
VHQVLHLQNELPIATVHGPAVAANAAAFCGSSLLQAHSRGIWSRLHLNRRAPPPSPTISLPARRTPSRRAPPSSPDLHLPTAPHTPSSPDLHTRALPPSLPCPHTARHLLRPASAVPRGSHGRAGISTARRCPVARSSPVVAMAGRGFGRGGVEAAVAWWMGPTSRSTPLLAAPRCHASSTAGGRTSSSPTRSSLPARAPRPTGSRATTTPPPCPSQVRSLQRRRLHVLCCRVGADSCQRSGGGGSRLQQALPMRRPCRSSPRSSTSGHRPLNPNPRGSTTTRVVAQGVGDAAGHPPLLQHGILLPLLHTGRFCRCATGACSK